MFDTGMELFLASEATDTGSDEAAWAYIQVLKYRKWLELSEAEREGWEEWYVDFVKGEGLLE